MKGILANWLWLAAFMATVESDLAGKIVGVWFPISAFVMIGLEHRSPTSSCCRSA